MKKEYIKPEVSITTMVLDSHLLAGSGGGNNAQPDDNTSRYGGTGSAGMAPENPGIWEEWEEDEN